MRFISLLLLGWCACVVCVVMGSSLVCEVVLVPYVVGAIVAVTVMRLLLFVLDVTMLRECERDGNSGVGDVGGTFAV